MDSKSINITDTQTSKAVGITDQQGSEAIGVTDVQTSKTIGVTDTGEQITIERTSTTNILSSEVMPGRVLPSVGYSNGSNKLVLDTPVSCASGNTIHIRCSFDDVSVGTQYLIRDAASSNRRIYLSVASRFVIEPVTVVKNLDVDWNIESGVVNDLYFQNDAGVWTLYFNGREYGTADTTPETDLSVETLLRGANFTGQLHYFGIYSRLLTLAEMTARDIITTDLKVGYVVSGRGLYEYDITGGGNNATWSGDANHYDYTLGNTNYYLENGYKLYEKIGELDEYVPTTADVTALTGAGYSLARTYVGDSTKINMYPSKFRFTNMIQASDVRTPLTGAANLGTAGAGTIGIFMNDRRHQIRQNGVVNYARFYYVDNTPANTDTVLLQSWRRSGSTFVKVNSLDITSQTVNQGTGIKTVKLDWDVQEGDFWVFQITNNAANDVLFGTAAGASYYEANNTSIYTYDGVSGDTFDWRTNGTPQKLALIVNGFMSPPQIVGIGDSQMSGSTTTLSEVDSNEGVAFSPDDPIMGQLFTLDNNLFIHNLGVAGQELPEINGINTNISRYRDQALNAKSEFVVIQGGINDLADGVKTNQQIVDQLINMADRSNDEGRFPVVLHITPWTNGSNAELQRRDAINALLDTEMSTKTGVAVNLDTAIGQFRIGGDAGNLWDQTPSLTQDGVHPNPYGYAAIASEIYGVLTGINHYDNFFFKVVDRSNTTYQTATSRASGNYDLLQPFEYFITELTDLDTLESYLNTGYKDKINISKTYDGSDITSLDKIKITKVV